MINNLSYIKPLLTFEEEGDFYMLYIFKRKKDFPEMEQKNHQSVRTIKSYCVTSVKYLDKRWEEIVKLCELFQAQIEVLKEYPGTDTHIEELEFELKKLTNEQKTDIPSNSL